MNLEGLTKEEAGLEASEDLAALILANAIATVVRMEDTDGS